MDQPEIITSSVRWTLPLSLAVHGFVLFILVWGAMPRQLQAPVLRAITVDLVSPEQLAAMVVPTPEPEAPPVPAQVTPIAPPVMPPPLDEMVRATDFFAADILADPDNAEVRDNFPLLAGSEQVVQLCNMGRWSSFAWLTRTSFQTPWSATPSTTFRSAAIPLRPRAAPFAARAAGFTYAIAAPSRPM